MPNAPPAAWGPFVEIGPARLAADVRSRRGRPAIEWVEFQPGDVNADLWTGTRPRREARIQYAARPDVIVLLGAGRARERVPIELDGPEQHARFRSALRLPVLLDALWGGEGAVTGQLLPAPAEGPRAARRAPSAESFPAGAASRGGPPSVARPLRIPWLEGRAPVLPVHVPADDELVLATGERVALWLRAHGLRSEARPFRDEEEAVGMRLVRFRPESRDLALSLLAFAGRHTSLRSQGAKAVLQNPRLLSASIVQRRLAAEALERAWLQGSEAIPLMTVAYWLAMDPAVRGVRLREDGVPLLESAHWRGR